MRRKDIVLPNTPENQNETTMRRFFSQDPDGRNPFPRKPNAARHLWRLLYLVELDPDIMSNLVFQRANPRYVLGMPCFYAGSTSQTPEARFREHKSGGRNASRVVHGFCENLRMDLVPSAGKRFPRERALKEEVRLARELRAKGFGVWQA